MSLKRVSNPPNPWYHTHEEWIGEPPLAKLEVFEEEVKSILSENDSPDIGFRYSLNPYRGCMHACAYCYARPSHQYWGFGAGTDFETKIIVKINAPEKLHETFMKPSWKGECIVFSGNTDCYQPLEASYKLTRQCLEMCHTFRNPVALITKSALIQRDVDVLANLSRDASCHVSMSIAFSDDKMARLIEPTAPNPTARFKAMRILSEAGIRVGVGVAPIIPGLNDDQIPEILKRAKENGATSAFRVLLRLAAEVKPVFIERLQEAFPDRSNKVLNAIRQVRGGKLYQSEFHKRMEGSGERWKVIEQLFDMTCKKVGLNLEEENHEPKTESFPRTTFQRSGQLSLLGI
jgi:DNA repair photolyase